MSTPKYIIDIQVAVETPLAEALLVDTLTAIATATLTHQDAQRGAELCLVISDNATVHQLNRDYAGKDKPTDVLSFVSEAGFPGQGGYLGDIIISIEMAAKNATENGHALLAELQLLTVHGCLHLMGHDHGDPEEKAEMWAAQAEVLAEAEIQVNLPA